MTTWPGVAAPDQADDLAHGIELEIELLAPSAQDPSQREGMETVKHVLVASRSVIDLLKKAVRMLLGLLGVPRGRALALRLAKMWAVLSWPATVLYLLYNPRIDPVYGLTWRRKAQLAYRMWRTTRGVNTGTSYKAHLAMASKLLQIPPSVEGVVVECGCWLGGSTANLSLVCDIVGRRLIVYDSFEGLPPPEENDQFAKDVATGMFKGELEIVRENVRRFGAVERCTFRKGWFSDTLPSHTEPVVLAFLDVDWQASLDDCITNLWPHLTESGYVFIDEFVFSDYCALFWSERYWKTRFDTTPPGLIGSGSGVGVGGYYLGPFHEWDWIQDPTSIAYTRKDFSGYWSYYPEDSTAQGKLSSAAGQQ